MRKTENVSKEGPFASRAPVRLTVLIPLGRRKAKNGSSQLSGRDGWCRFHLGLTGTRHQTLDARIARIVPKQSSLTSKCREMNTVPVHGPHRGYRAPVTYCPSISLTSPTEGQHRHQPVRTYQIDIWSQARRGESKRKARMRSQLQEQQLGPTY